MNTTTPPVLKLEGIRISFGPIAAVKGVSLQIERGEIVGLIGENGAGKSTLLKILTGIYQPDSGTIEVNGTPVRLRGPRDAIAAGVGVVHQEQSLFSNLSVAENIEMNTPPGAGGVSRLGLYRWRRLNRDAAATLEKIGSKLDPRTRVGDLSFVDRQMVEIARAIHMDPSRNTTPLVILDEPTSLLERKETAILEREMRKLRDVGAVIFVSHRLDEVLRVCDRVVVMRHGELIADRRTEEVTEDDLFHLMVGREMHSPDRRHRPIAADSRPAVEVSGLTRKGKFRDVSFAVHPGRCTVIVGTSGSGREALSRALFGAETFDSGSLTFGGRPAAGWTIAKATNAGVGYVPAERKVEGMVGGLPAAQNLTLTHPGPAAAGPVILPAKRDQVARTWFDALDVRPNDISLELERFSGGNQQKVVLAKWLNSPDLRVLVLDHPLRGLDPGAAETVNEQIRRARDEGTAVVLLADTLEEALEMGDEVVVMRDGVVTGHFDVATDDPSTLDLLERML
ncbi:sugar ABC transporter ATP-binding protein [Agromyces binzhouensis]|uniref:sugar ABC transporter ATP-binding protein n=1 Tax=Agromyces binzhouensis TaxID=1817495 RepID=UPI0013EA26D6|nr:sugar ABC transporter ATP-binding protein [Agromyces binzhouensis]